MMGAQESRETAGVPPNSNYAITPCISILQETWFDRKLWIALAALGTYLFTHDIQYDIQSDH
jgi:hypothetical protein